MTMTTILSQLAFGLLRTVGLFCWDARAVAASRHDRVVWQDVEKSCAQLHNKDLHIYNARNAAHAAAPRCLFRAVLPFRGKYRSLQISGVVAFGFVINYAAYFAEIFRSGIQSMPQGQYEAADVLGYTKSQTFIKIILPQVIKRVLPPVTNETITLVKDTSLAYALTYAEMFTLAKQIAAAERSFIPLFVAGVFYYVFNYIVAEIMNQLEKKLNYYK